ncbi:MAG: hypothetical protein HN542_04370 [Flavobacteriales bacterium]|jgi:hypothetical protein|nr:hypothetical protein [Flavobacteriales bacterium]MBT3963082.1 hypothetical protein [Flavobacteriales bacterium]MBT4705978.1 hypothetical protein [Flavobacteriales bacterium]MBT4931500.1 hypothetical protein [Flavobacteriales bacterium]MBT5131612.1 hypothetical protein [Flavobacteriales bacterium]
MSQQRIFISLVMILGSWTMNDVQAQTSRWLLIEHYGNIEHEEQSFLLADFDYSLESNGLTNALLNEAVFDGKINSASSAYLLDSEGPDRLTLAGGVRGSLTYLLQRENGLNFIFSAGMSDMITSSSTKGLYQLYLLGNGPFEDQTMSLGSSKFRYMSAQYLGFGIDVEKEQHRFGLTVNIQKVSRYQYLEINDGSELYTAPYGEELGLSVQATSYRTTTSQSKLGAWQGTAATLNAYYVFRPSSGRSLFSLEINDLGAIHFGGFQEQSANLDSTFSGFEVADMLHGGFTISSSGDLDSLEALFGVESIASSGFRPTWGRLRISYVNQLNNKLSLMITGTYMAGSPLPEGRVGLCLHLTNSLALEPYLKVGGFARANTGLSLAVIPSSRFQVLLRYGLLGSNIIPNNSTSQQVSGALSFGF